ncbi:hypothetical protein BDR04DRAFT_990322, partial [Suillus decipiens]
VLTGPENFQLWKFCITEKLFREKVLHVITCADPDPTAATTTAITAPSISTISASSKAHGIIQDHISDALLMKKQVCVTAKALFDELINDHIAKFHSLESHLTGMSSAIDSRIITFVLMHSLPDPPDW